VLHVLQSGTYFAVGDDRPRRADVRVISATNLDLDRAVDAGTFLADLLYRLAVFRIRVPGLDERREDIEPIARQALLSACERFGFVRLTLAPSGAAALAAHGWRGHVRELVHHVEAGAVRAAGEGLEAVEARHVFTEAGASAEGVSFQEATRRYQRELVKETLEATGWNVAEAARRLDLARSYLDTLISGFGLERQ
jgi:DNA-binding NtrC family response regulator